MRKLIVTEFMTLDGVVEAPHEWSFPYWNDDIARFKLDEIMTSDILLLGRVTYDGFAAAWPNRENDEAGFTEKINTMPKYVASNSLKTADWNNTRIIRANLIEEVRQLKQQDGGFIMVAGSPNLIQTLVREGQVDEFWLLVYPIVLYHGKRLFYNGSEPTSAGPLKLKLNEVRSIGSGVILQRYETERA